ncbi:unnamed protein product, partial [Rotaria sordida]
MYNSNIDNSSNSANMPPRGSSDRSKSHMQTSRSSTSNRSLHRTLRSQFPSSSITRWSTNRSSSGRSHNLRNIVADSSIHSTNILSSSIHSGKNVQASLNQDQNDNDITMEFNSIVINVDSYQNQTFPTTTNSVQTNHSFELDKALPPKMATTLSGKKTAEEVSKFFEMQHDGTQRRKREIGEALLQCIIGAGLPYSMFNHSSVIQFLKVLIPEYTPPDRHKLSSRIINEYHQYINDLK